MIKLISVTPDAENTIAYCARVSGDQTNPDPSKLLKYCMTHGHWSVFEMAHMTVEITTSRAIAAQILRHRSFSFQEFSQRYSKIKGSYQPCHARRQDTKNKQNSIDDLPTQDIDWFLFAQNEVYKQAMIVYNEALKRGIAKECARMILPLNTTSKLYMTGSIRSWIHYLKVRMDPSTQKEHRDVAEGIYKIFVEQFPVIGELI